MSALALKIIATVTMVLDHFGIIFSDVLSPDIFRLIGRISFPIFAFITAQSVKHTKNTLKYFSRLFISAIVLELGALIPKLFMDTPLGTFSNLNIFFTLSCAVLIIIIHNILVKHLPFPIPFAITVFITFLSQYIPLDYGIFGIVLIMIFYFVKDKIFSILLAAALIIFYYSDNLTRYFETYRVYNLFIPIFALISLIFIAFYNEKKGRSVNKYVFYIIYPAHMVILYGIHALLFAN